MKKMSTNTNSATIEMMIPAILRNMAILPRTRAPSQSRGATCLEEIAKQTASNPEKNEKKIG